MLKFNMWLKKHMKKKLNLLYFYKFVLMYNDGKLIQFNSVVTQRAQS